MLKIAFVVYRQWGYKIFENILNYQKIRSDFSINTLITIPQPGFPIDGVIKKMVKTYQIDPLDKKSLYRILTENEIDIVCFYSWSFKVDKLFLDNFICLCLHPSLVPKFRGGTPIQNQIMDGVTDSGVSIFKMTNEIDAGDVYQQTVISLLGNINDIFNRMIDVGTIMSKHLISDYLNNELKFIPQNLANSKVYKRRKPSQSEIDLSQLKSLKYQDIDNLVRGLLDPYPNAYINLSTVTIYIQEIEKYYAPFKNSLILSADHQNFLSKKEIFLQLSDSYARLITYKIVTHDTHQ